MSKTAELTARIALRVKQVTKKQQRNKEELVTLIKGREQNKTAYEPASLYLTKSLINMKMK